MSAQQRFRSLVTHIGRIYAAPDCDQRTTHLQDGLAELVEVMNPSSSADWVTMGKDSDRLMKVWVAKEGGTEAAAAVVAQLAGMLEDLADATGDDMEVECVQIKVEPPALKIHEPIQHVAVPAVPTVVVAAPAVVVKAVEEVAMVEDEKEVVVEVEDAHAEPSDADEEEQEEEVLEPEDEEAAEEEAAEEEEGGMEVEIITFRGRQYWMDVNTKKLYGFTGEDEDIGDEVGEVVNGKPTFYAAK